MKRSDVKSHCPVNFALETFGDSWSLLIVRDIAFWGKHTFGEFLTSEEGIATNILAARLAHLEQVGILAKRQHATDRRKAVYTLTEKGIDLVPVLLEMSGWSAQYDEQTTAPLAFVAHARADRTTAYERAKEIIRSGQSLFGN